MVVRDELIGYCDERLRSVAFQDVAINGLQVAGANEIRKLAVAVSTSRVTLAEAIDWGADALLVHHGIFWSGKQGPITGVLAERLRLMLRNDLNLIGYHLPLDGHPEIGNNVLLSQAAGFSVVSDGPRFGYVGREPLGVVGVYDGGMPIEELVANLRAITEREPVLVGDLTTGLTVSWAAFLSGSGYSAVAEVAELGCQVLVTGDVRESTMAEARELGIVVIAAGHEATERLGVQALAAELADRFGVETHFIPDPNPI